MYEKGNFFESRKRFLSRLRFIYYILGFHFFKYLYVSNFIFRILRNVLDTLLSIMTNF